MKSQFKANLCNNKDKHRIYLYFTLIYVKLITRFQNKFAVA